MSEKSPSSPSPGQPNTRSRIALVVLALIAAFVVYGVFERSRLIADLARERIAIESIAALDGETMEADSKDWRAMFSPDKPEQATRVGYVTLPASGAAPGYQKKVTEILEDLPYCQQLYVVEAPSKTEPKTATGAGDQPKEDQPKEDQPKEDQPKEDQPNEDKPNEDKPNEEKKTDAPEKSEPIKSEEKAPDTSTESLNFDELKKQFPSLVIHVIPRVSKGEARGPMGS